MDGNCRRLWSVWSSVSRASVRFLVYCFFFQAEDGIRDAQESRGLGDVYKRQAAVARVLTLRIGLRVLLLAQVRREAHVACRVDEDLSLIHI